VCRLPRKQEKGKKKYKENISKTFAKADKPFGRY
jgi:hypothetical protein